MARPLVVGRDFVFDARGMMVFTREFLLARGRCCLRECRNCPWKSPDEAKPADCDCGWPEARTPGGSGHGPDCPVDRRYRAAAGGSVCSSPLPPRVDPGCSHGCAQ